MRQFFPLDAHGNKVNLFSRSGDWPKADLEGALYAMCTCKAPFSWRVEESDEFDDIPVTVSEKLRRCIASCLAFNSEERPGAFGLLRLVQRMRSDPKTRHLVPLQSQETSDKSVDPHRHRQSAIPRHEHADILRRSLPGLGNASGNPKKHHSDEIDPTSGHFAATKLHPRPLTPHWLRSPRFTERVTPAFGNTTVLPTSQPIPQFLSLEKELKGHSAGVWAVAFSPDGKQIDRIRI